MAQEPLQDVETTVGESRRDRALRESFALGFAVLLALVFALGALAYRRIETLEEEVTRRAAIDQQHLNLVFELDEQAGRLSAEAKTFLVTRTVGASTFAVSHRIGQLKKQMGRTLEKGSETQLGRTPEWDAFVRAFAAYTASLEAPEPAPDAVGEAYDRSLRMLLLRVRSDVAASHEHAAEMRQDAQRDVAVATGACLGVGLVVSALSFLQARRRIAQLRGAYRRLANNKELIESTLEGMDSAVLTVGLDGRVTRINGAAIRLLGVERPDEVVGRDLGEALARQPVLHDMIAPLAASEHVGRRYLGRVEMGEERWLFDVGASPLTMGAGVSGYIVTLTDVTEAERASEELRRNRALMAIGQMTAQVAHEIKNPLGGVRLAAQLLARRFADDEQALDVIRRIENSVDHLNRTVVELNQFARPRELALEPVRLDAMMDELLEMVGDRVESKRIRVERRYDGDVAEAMYDAGELRKAFINFLINALDASDDGAVLEVEIADEDATARVTIRDHGAGMAEETRRRLFEPFYTTKATGTGLGMAIARKIVEQHKGRLEVRSAEGVGTTVTVTLPTTLVAAEAEATVRERA